MTSNTINNDAQLLRQGKIVLTNLLYWLGTFIVSVTFYILTIRGVILSTDLCVMSFLALSISALWSIHLIIYWAASPDERDAMRWRTTALTFLQGNFPVIAVVYVLIAVSGLLPHDRVWSRLAQNIIMGFIVFIPLIVALARKRQKGGIT